MNLSTALAAIIDQLKEAGLPACRHIREAHKLPVLLVYPDEITFDRLDGHSYTYQVELALIAADTGFKDDSLDALSAMVEKLRQNFGIKHFKAEALGIPNLSGDPLPALSATATFNIPDKE